MKTQVLAKQKYEFEHDRLIQIDIPEIISLRVDNLQIDINSGRKMFNKKITIRAFGYKGEEITIVTEHEFSVPHTELIDTDLNGPEWDVRKIEITSCQENNFPLEIGILSLNIPKGAILKNGFICKNFTT